MKTQEEMRSLLEDLTEQIENEILTTGTILIQGKPAWRNTLKKETNPFKGLCSPAITKLKELIPYLEIVSLSFKYNLNGEQGNHVIGEVKTHLGFFHVDPTIKQFIPEAKSVYGPGETYPLPAIEGTIKRYNPLS